MTVPSLLSQLARYRGAACCEFSGGNQNIHSEDQIVAGGVTICPENCYGNGGRGPQEDDCAVSKSRSAPGRRSKGSQSQESLKVGVGVAAQVESTTQYGMKRSRKGVPLPENIGPSRIRAGANSFVRDLASSKDKARQQQTYRSVARSSDWKRKAREIVKRQDPGLLQDA
ncbi:hypothetical protein K438DRAFT_1776140 [Mycena galopus ATCC 62051]|nr:hypothetical protein K438DRAFT_1776140 [Mycena galopus ATCC 62051]